jgi:hypothetical protein
MRLYEKMFVLHGKYNVSLAGEVRIKNEVPFGMFFYPTCCVIRPCAQYLPEVWKRAREAERSLCKKPIFSAFLKNRVFDGGCLNFFGSSHNGWLLPEFFSDFYI